MITTRIEQLRLTLAVAFAVLSFAFFFCANSPAHAVASAAVSPAPTVRIGEKLTYTLSFGKMSNVGFAETQVVSRGKIGGREAVEIRARVKTLDVVSAAFLLLDETRTVFASPENGFPLYITTNSLDSISPKPVIRNYLQQPAANLDFVTLLFKVRESAGTGTFPILEGDQISTITLQTSVTEKVRTEAGDFETTVSTVQSELLTSLEIKDFKINFSTDEARVPVLIRMKTPRGEIRASLSAVSLPEPDAVGTPAPTPSPAPTAKPTPAGKPTPAVEEYVENAPLMPELGFALGEVLDYKFTNAGKPVGVVSLNARERKQFDKVDTLVLILTVASAEPGTTTLRAGDFARALVDPDTLAPNRFESRITSPLAGLNQTAVFDKRSGNVNFGGKAVVDAPIGTHSLLSLLYAMRSFNLKPSDNRSAPVNDTRVAVFWDGKPLIFTLRPAKPDDITLNGEKVSAQLISISTGSKELDGLSPKIWLRTDDRVPLRISVGTLQGDLVLTPPPTVIP